MIIWLGNKESTRKLVEGISNYIIILYLIKIFVYRF